MTHISLVANITLRTLQQGTTRNILRLGFTPEIENPEVSGIAPER